MVSPLPRALWVPPSLSAAPPLLLSALGPRLRLPDTGSGRRLPPDSFSGGGGSSSSSSWSTASKRARGRREAASTNSAPCAAIAHVGACVLVACRSVLALAARRKVDKRLQVSGSASARPLDSRAPASGPHVRLPGDRISSSSSLRLLTVCQAGAGVVVPVLTDLEPLTLVQIKEQLRSLSLPVSGRKAELISRLQAATPKNGKRELLSTGDNSDSSRLLSDAEAVGSYDGLSVGQLKEQLRKRALAVSGRKGDLIARLLAAGTGSSGAHSSSSSSSASSKQRSRLKASCNEIWSGPSAAGPSGVTGRLSRLPEGLSLSQRWRGRISHHCSTGAVHVDLLNAEALCVSTGVVQNDWLGGQRVRGLKDSCLKLGQEVDVWAVAMASNGNADQQLVSQVPKSVPIKGKKSPTKSSRGSTAGVLPAAEGSASASPLSSGRTLTLAVAPPRPRPADLSAFTPVDRTSWFRGRVQAIMCFGLFVEVFPNPNPKKNKNKAKKVLGDTGPGQWGLVPTSELKEVEVVVADAGADGEGGEVSEAGEGSERDEGEGGHEGEEEDEDRGNYFVDKARVSATRAARAVLDTFTIGQPVQVRVVAVDLESGRLGLSMRPGEDSAESGV
ncbi:unnamed protein product [Polarella glacialis]|uniref:SAP domain-containing protein n=1 Tax=Polarella glacialis TaxID=89957 RepID=A0A813EWJ3_POLGL|nr:unnamed protein product [Polarella glacialis]CAE8635037.1 unnamed protein product [Polarella glacialis]